MAMARAYWRATHHPVAFVFTTGGRFSLIATGCGMAFIGGLNVSHAAEALMTDTTDLTPFRALQAAFVQKID
jgi:hypothetical protein